jgi:hypothetical protein
MHLMADVFMDLLDISVEKIRRSRDFTVIETNTHQIRIFYFNEEDDIYNTQLRGLRADIVINNTNNSTIDILSKTSILVSSPYYDRLLKE